ncbi:inorganic pyrophosphatase [Alistipes sp.]|uniref:inorganic pyrophosphatase n=1 Tax=Alistipes sp. TaxID=1872444 RepID=UPI003A8A78B4
MERRRSETMNRRSEPADGSAAFGGAAASFWEALDALVAGAEIVVDRPRGSHHPDFPAFVYELDYGYLKGTTSADGEGIDVWIGSDPRRRVTGALCTVDLVKRDAELKILVGCTAHDCAVIRRFYRTPLSAVRVLRRR